MNRKNIIMIILMIIGILTFLIGAYFLVDLAIENNGTYSKVYFNGTDNIECHSVQVDRNDWLGSYYFEEECNIINYSMEKKQ